MEFQIPALSASRGISCRRSSGAQSSSNHSTRALGIAVSWSLWSLAQSSVNSGPSLSILMNSRRKNTLGPPNGGAGKASGSPPVDRDGGRGNECACSICEKKTIPNGRRALKSHEPPVLIPKREPDSITGIYSEDDVSRRLIMSLARLPCFFQ